MIQRQNAMLLNPADNVATALEEISSGADVVAGPYTLVAMDTIPLGHKVALADIPVGKGVIKYGEIIGLCKTFIAKGQHVHRHNVEHRVDEMIFKLREEARP